MNFTTHRQSPIASRAPLPPRASAAPLSRSASPAGPSPEMVKACGDDRALALSLHAAGMTVAQAAVAAGHISAHRTTSEARGKIIDEFTALQQATRSAADARAASGSATSGSPGKKPFENPGAYKLDNDEAGELAEREWKNNIHDCRAAFVSKGVYVAFRSRVLTHRHRH